MQTLTKPNFGKRNWLILILFGLIGQIAWSVENMYFNLFVFDTIAPDLDAPAPAESENNVANIFPA